MNQKNIKFFYHFGDKNLSLLSLKNNDKTVIKDFKIPTTQIILAEQVHGNLVRIVNKKDIGKGISRNTIPKVDALITNEKNIFLAIKTADCVPILIFDPISEIIVAIHSGREGTRKNIVGETLKILINSFGADPKNMMIKLGPSICEKCYEVDKNTFDHFVKSTGIEQEFPFLNIKKVLLHQFMNEGISKNNIENNDVCTFENKDYFSYRRGGTDGRQVSLIGKIECDI